MTSNYKKLGQYIQQVSSRNTDLSVTNLQGVSITKKFIPSIANIIGTNMATYKKVYRHQFAYGPVTSRNGDRISVALLDQDEAIISQAYTVFEVIDHNQLDPEYLMMWFRRSEFDRYARFKSHGSVREIFGWDEMCDVELPIPDITEQKRIVAEYKTVTNRIKLNKRLNKKLEDTAQSIYKQWFLDFEFPISAEYAESIGKPELAGKPYKSCGGKMAINTQYGAKLPYGWGYVAFTTNILLGGGGTPKTEVASNWNGDIPFFTPKDVGQSYFSTSTEKTLTTDGLHSCSTRLYPKDTIFITARGTVGVISLASKNMAMNQSCYAATPLNGFGQYFTHQHILNTLKSLKNEATGGVFGALVTRDFEGALVIEPDIKIISMYDELVTPVYAQILTNQNENEKLTELCEALLSRVAILETEV